MNGHVCVPSVEGVAVESEISKRGVGAWRLMTERILRGVLDGCFGESASTIRESGNY